MQTRVCFLLLASAPYYNEASEHEALEPFLFWLAKEKSKLFICRGWDIRFLRRCFFYKHHTIINKI